MYKYSANRHYKTNTYISVSKISKYLENRQNDTIESILSNQSQAYFFPFFN